MKLKWEQNDEFDTHAALVIGFRLRQEWMNHFHGYEEEFIGKDLWTECIWTYNDIPMQEL